MYAKCYCRCCSRSISPFLVHCIRCMYLCSVDVFMCVHVGIVRAAGQSRKDLGAGLGNGARGIAASGAGRRTTFKDESPAAKGNHSLHGMCGLRLLLGGLRQFSLNFSLVQCFVRVFVQTTVVVAVIVALVDSNELYLHGSSRTCRQACSHQQRHPQ